MVKVYKLHPATFYFLIIVILLVVIGTFVFPAYRNGTVVMYKVVEAGLDWNDVSKKLIENGFAEKISTYELRLKVDLRREKSRILEIFGNDFLRIFPAILEQARDNKIMYFLGLFLTPALTIGLILGLLLEIRIDDKKIWGHGKYLPWKGKSIKFEDIKLIDDDHYLFGHVFRLFPHVNIEGNLIQKLKDVGKALRFPNFIKNYDDLLREILVRCNPGTKVEEIVLRKADMTWEQVEIERRKRWLEKPA